MNVFLINDSFKSVSQLETFETPDTFNYARAEGM